MKTLIIADENSHYDVFSLDGDDVRAYFSLTDFVNRYLASPHIEHYRIRTIYSDDVCDEQEEEAIHYLIAAIPEPGDSNAFWAFNMLYNSETAYDGIQLD